MLVFGLAIAGLAAKVIEVKPPILAGAILVLAVFGSYSVQNSMADVAIMLVLGIGMYFLAQYGFSPAPLVLGIILGPIAEHNYVQGRIIGEAQDGIAAYFLTGWLNVLLIAFVVLSLGYSVAAEIRRKNARQGRCCGSGRMTGKPVAERHANLPLRSPPAVAGRLQQSGRRSHQWTGGCRGWITIVSFDVGGFRSRSLFPRSSFPGSWVALSLMALLRAVRGRNRTGAGISGQQFLNIAAGLAVMLVYVFALAEWLGFYSAAFLAMLTVYSLYDPQPHGKVRTWAVRLAVTVGFVAVIYAVFALGLKVQTPQGILF